MEKFFEFLRKIFGSQIAQLYYLILCVCEAIIVAADIVMHFVHNEPLMGAAIFIMTGFAFPFFTAVVEALWFNVKDLFKKR